ncbi:unnamed protein product [Paramecium octaurelia]|uniref:Uncharacterized protein n=1 Tax=Paramecium octaurelia TaxID=43137 RepID=A0A8S1WJX0_PAROT|nr:unnamed protein product [Paramecium octaurelia]
MIHIHKICEKPCSKNSFGIFKQNVKNSRMVLNNKVNNPQETFTQRNVYQVPQYHLKEQQYKKVDEWQKQDLSVKYSYLDNHFIPKKKNTLKKSRFIFKILKSLWLKPII